MTPIPRKRVRPKMGLREPSQIRSRGHMQWVRSRGCAIADKPGHACTGRYHAHHVQSYRAMEGGMGLKVGDNRTVCLCDVAHDEVHRIGQTAFEKKWNVDLEKWAASAWANSEHRFKYEQKMKERA